MDYCLTQGNVHTWSSVLSIKESVHNVNPVIIIAGLEINESVHLSYLGLVMDSTLQFNPYVDCKIAT